MATTKRSRKAPKKSRRGTKRAKKSRVKVTWVKPKGKLVEVCKHCYEDTSLPETCQFGKPRGMDIRRDHATGPRSYPYCGTCGEDYGVTKIRV